MLNMHCTPRASWKRLACIVIFPALIAFVIPQSFAAPIPFEDTREVWFRYRYAIAALKEKGIIHGYPDGTFHPYASINRAEFLKLIYVDRVPEGTRVRRCFRDVPPSTWFAPFICKAKEEGIVEGYSTGLFLPGQTVNMAEAIKMMLETEGWDVPKVTGTDWFEPYIEASDARDVLSRSSFLPWEPLTRMRAADLVYRMALYRKENRTLRTSIGCKNPSTVPTSVTVHGRQRSFLLTQPGGSGDDPRPVIVAFHGRTNSNVKAREYYGLDEAAREFIIVYPEAIQRSDGSYSWSNGEGKPDKALFDAIIETVSAHACIDMNRIYVTGHSLGAWMSNSLACVRGDVIRGSATVGGSSVMTECTGPSAALIAHNPVDNLAAFWGSERVRDLRIVSNACSVESVQSAPVALKCKKYLGCVKENPVLFCPHEDSIGPNGVYYPHTWPDRMGRMITDFFRGLGD